MKKESLILLSVFALIMLVVLPVSAVVYSGGVIISPNKYVPIQPYVPPDYGTIHISNLAHNGIYSTTEWVHLVDPNNATEIITVTNRGDGSQDVQVPGGAFKSGGLEYEVRLLDGNGDQPETRDVWVTNGYTSNALFIGHATSADPIMPAPTTVSPITITFAEYVGSFNVYGVPGTVPGHESVKDQMQEYLNANPGITMFSVQASVGNILINNNPVTVGDPASGWVKTLTVAYTYKDSHGHTKLGEFIIAENDAMSYNDGLLKHLPETGTIST